MTGAVEVAGAPWPPVFWSCNVEVAHLLEQAPQLAEPPPGRPGARQHAFEQRERGPQPAGRHPHVAQLLDPRQACRAPWPAPRRAWRWSTAKASSPMEDVRAETTAGPRSGVPGISWPTASSPRFELGEMRRLEAARRAELLDDRLEGAEPPRADLHLDPPQRRIGRWLSSTKIDVSSSATSAAADAADPQRENGRRRVRTWEHLMQRARADDGARPPPDRATSAPSSARPRRGTSAGLLEPLAEGPQLLRRGGCPSAWTSSMTATAPGYGRRSRRAGACAQAVGVEVGVDPVAVACGRARHHGAALSGFDDEAWARWPATSLHRSRWSRAGRTATRSRRGSPCRPGLVSLESDTAGQATGRVLRDRPDRPTADCRRLPTDCDVERTVTCDAVARRTMTAELPSPTEVVQAAGGLVVRRQGGLLELVVVHRPMHQDWSFPKGKLEPGETFELAAPGEVREGDRATPAGSCAFSATPSTRTARAAPRRSPTGSWRPKGVSFTPLSR